MLTKNKKKKKEIRREKTEGNSSSNINQYFDKRIGLKG